MYQQCVDLIKSGKSKEAAEYIMSTTDEDRIRYNRWTQIRRILYRDESNRHYDYYTNMHLLSEHPGVTEEIQEKLETIADDTLQNQNRIHGYKKRIIPNAQIDAIFKDIRPMFDSFYDFVLPPDVQINRKEHQRVQATKKVDASTISMTITEAEEMLQCAIDVLELKHIISFDDVYKTIAALLIVSGRRNIEIMFVAEFEPGPTEYQARVRNLAKQQADEWMCIPLLCKFDSFISKLEIIRDALQDNDFHEHQDATKMCNEYGRIAHFLHIMAQQKFNHTLRRNIYIELAWAKRYQQSRFLVEDHAVSKFRWAQYALCHNTFHISDTMLYQSVELTDDGTN